MINIRFDLMTMIHEKMIISKRIILKFILRNPQSMKNKQRFIEQSNQGYI